MSPTAYSFFLTYPTLGMLHTRPDHARHIRSLGISTDSSPSPDVHGHGHGYGRWTAKWGRGALPDATLVSAAVRQAARNLEVLRTFVWDGEELPTQDDMWFALSTSCVVPPPTQLIC